MPFGSLWQPKHLFYMGYTIQLIKIQAATHPMCGCFMTKRRQNPAVTSYRTTAKIPHVKGVYGLLQRMRASHLLVFLQRSYWFLPVQPETAVLPTCSTVAQGNRSMILCARWCATSVGQVNHTVGMRQEVCHRGRWGLEHLPSPLQTK